ncbi:MAG: ABC-type transport auxiliary lipoprotein family protein [Pseudomonadota bacterium]
MRETGFAAMVLVALLSGCAAIPTVGAASRPLAAYDLSPLVERTTSSPTGGYLLVEPPEASGGLATDRIMIRPDPLAVQYLPAAKWVEDAPSLVQRLIVESFMASGEYQLVALRDFGPNPDYVLVTDLTAFQTEATDAGFSVRVALVATLVRDRDRRILSSRAFEATRPAASSAPIDVVRAFDEATGEALALLRDWASEVAR